MKANDKANDGLTRHRDINWLGHTSAAIGARFPDTRDYAERLTERMALLVLERLAADLSEEILALLPEPLRVCSSFTARSIEQGGDPSIGYSTFIERASLSCGCSEDMAQQIADAFLWSFCQELPAELKDRMAEALPMELRSRMNLYSAHSDESKVA